MDEDEAGAVAIGAGLPGSFVIIDEVEDGDSGAEAEFDSFAAVIEFTLEFADDRKTGAMAQFEGGLISDHEDKFTGGKAAAEIGVDPFGESDVA